MKKLHQFARFDWDAFAAEKVFSVTAVSPWVDFKDKTTVLGTAVEVAIVEDRTAYNCKPGEVVTNQFGKLTFKVPLKSVSVTLGDLVEPVNPVATICGDFRDKLSVKADDVCPITT